MTNPHTNQTFVVYAAARVNTPFYCLGMLELTGSSPQQPQSWKKHKDGCVFHQNPEEGVYGTGHASFVRTLDGRETYVVYHALTTADPEREYFFSLLLLSSLPFRENENITFVLTTCPADLYRTVRAQKIEWNDDGTPRFPAAMTGPFPAPGSQSM